MVPLRPIWTIMVAAKLDQNRVPVTKFHQNRLTMKGTRARQRQTDRQTRLKISALQVLQSGQQTKSQTALKQNHTCVQ